MIKKNEIEGKGILYFFATIILEIIPVSLFSLNIYFFWFKIQYLWWLCIILFIPLLGIIITVIAVPIASYISTLNYYEEQIFYLREKRRHEIDLLQNEQEEIKIWGKFWDGFMQAVIEEEKNK